MPQKREKKWLSLVRVWIEQAKRYNPGVEVEESRDSVRVSFYVDYKPNSGETVKHLVVLTFKSNPLYKAPEVEIYRLENGKTVNLAHELPCHVIGGKPCIMSDDTWVSAALHYSAGPLVFAMLVASLFIKDFYEEDEKVFCSKTVF